MAELTKKQKKLLEELTEGTYKAPAEQRRESRDANLRKQQAEAEIAPVKATEDKGFWNSVGYTAKSFGTGVLGGITGIFEAGTTDIASNFAKGFEEKSNGILGQVKDVSSATLNILDPTKRIIDAPMKMIKDMNEIRNDDSKNWLQKLGSATTTAVSNTLESLFPEKTLVNEFLQTVGFANHEDLGEKVMEKSKDITKPYYDLSQEVYEEGQQYGGATETAGQVAQTVGRMIPSVVASAVTKNPQVGLGTMALSVKGSETMSAVNKGAELDEAIKIGNTKAMIEYGTEMLFGGINIFGKGALDDIVSKGVDAKVKKELANFLAKKGVSVGGEVLEEAIANTLGTIVDKGTVDPNASYNVDDFKEDTLITILSTLVLDGMTGGYGRRAYQNNIEEMQGQTTVTEEENIPTAEDIQAQQTQEIEAQIEEKTAELEASEDVREQQIIQEELEILDEELNSVQENAQQITETEIKPITNDNKGREIPKELQEKLKDVKTVDEKGNVKNYYHGTRGEFDTYDNSKIGQNYEGDWSILGKGFYFTENYDEAKEYGKSSTNEGEVNVREEYLDIKNPFYNDMAQNDSNVLDQLKEKYNLEESDFSDAYNLIRTLRNKGVDTTEVLKEYGYDGIITEDEAVVFDSEQVISVKQQTEETPVQDAKIEENASNEIQDAPTQEVKTDVKGRTEGKSFVFDEPQQYTITHKGETYDFEARSINNETGDYFGLITMNGHKSFMEVPKTAIKELSTTTKQDTKEQQVMTEEEYLESKGYPFMGYSEAGLHKTSKSESTRSRKQAIDLVQDRALEYDKKREELRKEYQEKVENGEIRKPNTIEKALKTAQGHEDNPSVQASRRLLEKRGIDWKTGEKINTENIEPTQIKQQVEEAVEEAIAPMQEIVTELVEQMKTVAPVQKVAPVQDVKTEINKNGVQMSVGEQVRTFNNSTYEVTDLFTTDDGVVRARLRDNKGYETSIGINAIAENLSDPTKNNVSTRVENDSLQSSEAVETQNTEAFDNITDEDAPSFEDLSDVFDEVGETEVAPTMPSPLENRDIDEVGSKKVKAYQYEHPEIRPYFQTEAENMLYDLDNTVKGEKIAIKDEAGYITEWAGTTRQTAEAIAYLKDKYGYSYAEIRKGLNAIIEDHGAENIAVAKRIEFMLDERLREGYTTSDGIEIPANEDYIKFLEEQGVTAYNLENFNAITDEDAPIEEAPVVEEVTTPPETNENIPTIENVEEVVKDVAPVQNVPENPNMDVTEGKQRRWAKTSTESEALEDKIQLNDLDVEKITYVPITNKETLSNVNKKIESQGYDKSLEEFKAKMISGKSVKAEDTTLGQRLIQEALKRGDKDTAIDLLQDITILGTEIGQAVQSLSIIQRMTPTGQLKMLEKTVDRAKAKGNKAFENVELTKEMKKKILDSFNDDGVTYDQDKLNKTMDEVKQELANQIKATKLDKVNAWRYLAMLGNPKTHIRNIVSNVAMLGTTEVKNALARTIETVAPVKERTKTWKDSSKDVMKFAEQTTIEMKEIISGDNKYNDETGIKALAKTFETEALEKVYNFNSDLLEKEDWWFSGARFKRALSEFLTANGINTEEDIFLNPELVEKGKNYALEQSRIATFRQYSYLANKIREIENKNTATNIAIGSIIPFKKTPINVAKTGLSYSPLGFAKTLTYDIAQVKKGNMEASQLIDNLSQNTTGTALALAGYMLAMTGFLSGAGGDDEEAKYDYQLGKQSYAVNIGNKSYSLSWLSPVAMPLFVGANAYSQLVEKEEWNGDVVVEALGQTLDPLNEMSFVSGLVDILSSYESGTQAIWGMVEAMGQNYATQFFPTLGSQVASVMDDTKRTTKVASDSDFKFVDETVNKIMYKIPKVRELLEPSTDIWGNEVKQTENVLQRALETFIAPYSAKESTATEIDENIKEVFRLTGDNGVIPNVPKNTITFNNEKYKMSGEEYTNFKKTYGQTANDLLEDLFRTTTYKQAGVDEKADMINEVYKYSSDIAKKGQLATEGVKYTNSTEDGEKVYKENTIKEAIKHDMTKEEYSLYSDDPEEYKFLEGKDSSYKRKYFNTQKSISDIEKTFNKRKNTIEAENMDEEEYDEAMEELANEKKKSVVNKIINSGLEDTEKASLYKRYYNSDTVDTIVKSAINVDDYLTYTTTEFKADYKSNGKAISGSRKKKVIEYVDSLNMDIPQKAILIKATNTFKFNDYNNDIIEYVDNLNISFDEKKSILKDLDMKVEDDGTIYWD